MIKGINRYIERHCPTMETAAASKPAAKGKDSK
jgi:hypothetical protein